MSKLFFGREINVYDAYNVPFSSPLSLVFGGCFVFVVINFFSLPVDDECLTDDGRRIGMCMNVYECRIQGIKKHFIVIPFNPSVFI